ncbi:MAG: class I SAM-dependent methyltransferase [Salibacteraceae bacterium]
MIKLFRTLFFFFPESVFGPFYFELKSFLGRLFQPRFKVDPSKRNLVNLGCGPIIIEGMINIDFFFEKNIDYGLDLRYPIKIDDNCIDGIVSEHTFEHLKFEDNKRVFKECHRILKPGGVFRVCVPDVSKYIMAYANNDKEWMDTWEDVHFTNSTNAKLRKMKLRTRMEAVSFIVQEWGHISAWDEETLKYYLLESGFSKVEGKKFREGKIPELLLDMDKDSRKNYSVYVEAYK